ncbi:MAG: hypothetical protein K0R88_573 [Solirubrobacterales bacterium]|jgi:hypothetical protein|nr:hypothetical protein [Solirubrobacterales bacterium]
MEQDERLRDTEILPALEAFTRATDRDDLGAQIEGLELLNISLGRALPFHNLAEFDEFMLNPETVLEI